MVRVRVRGIYATALSKILVDHGFQLVDVTEKIKERLSLEADETACDVTVKTTENPDELLIIGFPKPSQEVYSTLVEELKYVYTWKSPVELHAVYMGVVVEKHGEYCSVDIGGLTGTLFPCSEEPGSRLLVGVRKPPVKYGERLVLTKNFRLVGEYATLIHGEPRITFSEHITSSKTKARLSAIATAKLMGTGLGVHFRSSAKHADDETISSDIDRLLEEYKSLISKSKELVDNPPIKLRDGEFIAILGLTSLAKSILDGIRSQVTTTIKKHHSLKSMGLSDVVDIAEHVISKAKCSHENASLAEYIAEKLAMDELVEIVHIKPTGEVIALTSGRVLNVSIVNDEVVVVIERTMKSPGVYDGLEVEKKPGDIDYMVVDTGKPYISHNYYRSGNWIGTYVNVNTPPEVAPGRVKYHDLLIDVVVHPSGDVKVVDKDELSKAYEEGLITEHLYNYALNVVKSIVSNPMSYVFNPYTKH
ncbi:MAG: DUF402 domain-containing protein [Desulfurococcaceae archaeon]